MPARDPPSKSGDRCKNSGIEVTYGTDAGIENGKEKLAHKYSRLE